MSNDFLFTGSFKKGNSSVETRINHVYVMQYNVMWCGVMCDVARCSVLWCVMWCGVWYGCNV